MTSNLVDRLEDYFRRFLAVEAGLPLVLALWSLATHLYDCFDAFPYLGITSPTKRCGKTRAAEVLELFCARPLRTVGVTPAALFRSIEHNKPTLMVDEAEGLRGNDERYTALREILNAGYRKGQKVPRCERSGKGWVVREFETYSPKVLVLIGGLPDTLADRTIQIRMRRRYAGEKVDRFILARARLTAAPLQTECQKSATDNRALVQTYASADLKFLSDREAELWLPLFAVCQVAAPHRLGELEAVARRLASAKAADEPGDFGIRVLADVRDIFTNKSCDCMWTKDLLPELVSIYEAPWASYSNGNPLNERGLAKLLSPFGIRSQNIRIEKRVAKGYQLESFKDAFSRYLPPASATALHDP